MLLLVGFGIGFTVVLIAMILLSPTDNERLGCEDDIPCQECGRCCGDHLNADLGRHTYVYPRDLHR